MTNTSIPMDLQAESSSSKILLSRNEFDQAIQHEERLALTRGGECAAIFIGIDYIEFYIDRFGKQAGQLVVETIIRAVPQFFAGRTVLTQLECGKIGILAKDLTREQAQTSTADLRRAILTKLFSYSAVTSTCVIYGLPQSGVDSDRGRNLVNLVQCSGRGGVFAV